MHTHFSLFLHFFFLFPNKHTHTHNTHTHNTELLDEVHELQSARTSNTVKVDTSDLVIKEGTARRFFNHSVLTSSEHHKANVISAVICNNKMITASVDRSVKVRSVENAAGFPTLVAEGDDVNSSVLIRASPILCVRANPVLPHILASSEMGGAVTITNLNDNNKDVFVHTAHRKYVVQLAWSPCGKYLASASHDWSVTLFEMDVATLAVKVLKVLQYSGAIESVAFSDVAVPAGAIDYSQGKQPSSSSSSAATTSAPESTSASDAAATSAAATSAAATSAAASASSSSLSPAAAAPASSSCEVELAVSVRSDNKLYFVTVPSLATRTMNMNAFGDDFVSFTAMVVSYSPSGKYLLVSTDKDRLILFDRMTGTQVSGHVCVWCVLCVCVLCVCVCVLCVCVFCV